MKNKIIFTVLAIAIILLSPISTYSDMCPDNTEGCTNWVPYTQTILFTMDDETQCAGAIFACKRCCGGLIQYHIDTVLFDEACFEEHPIDMNGASFHSQFSSHLLSNMSLCPGVQVPPCPLQSSAIATISYAPCYKWSPPVAKPGGGYWKGLIACNNEIGCEELYTVCNNNGTYQWTLISTSYSAVCPTESGFETCFNVCIAP